MRAGSRTLRQPGLLVLGASIAVLVLTSRVAEYAVDAGPSVDALIGGRVHRFLAVQPLMGSFSVLVRAPFALAVKLAGAGELATYRAGVLACLLAVGAVAVALERRRRPETAGLVVPALAVLTPASLAAVREGHPEELLGAALCVAAVLFADRRPTASAVLLGLAIATKQWALVAVPPVLLAVPRGSRVKTLLVAAGVAAALTLPLLAGNVSAFADRGQQAASSSRTSARATVWFIVAKPMRIVDLPPGVPAATAYRIPSLVADYAHALIVLLAPVLGLLAWRRRGDPFGLLALLLLLRCVLDPVDNSSYHAPFLLALLAYEVRGRKRRPLPLLTLFASAALWLTFHLDAAGAAASLTNAVYLAWTCAVAVPLAVAVCVPRERRLRALSPAPA